MDKMFSIVDILPEGKSNAISADALTSLLQLRSKRELQRHIERERKAGALILSCSTGGYYTSHDPMEVQAFCKTLENRAKHTFLAIKTAKQFLWETAISQVDGQISMESL